MIARDTEHFHHCIKLFSSSALNHMRILPSTSKFFIKKTKPFSLSPTHFFYCWMVNLFNGFHTFNHSTSSCLRVIEGTTKSDKSLFCQWHLLPNWRENKCPQSNHKIILRKALWGMCHPLYLIKLTSFHLAINKTKTKLSYEHHHETYQMCK